MTERTTRPMIAAGLSLILAACSFSPLGNREGDTVYAQRNFWVSDGVHETTNYRGGYMIPVNAEVRIADTSARAIEGKVLDTGQRFTIVNVRKYTNRDIRAIFERYFGTDPRDLGGFDAAEREAIRKGEFERGMSRDAVLTARGFPPAHETPNIHADEWLFWKGGHDTVAVQFDGDRVASVRD